MQTDTLLSRLSGVKGRNGRWVARCPAHEDKSPSLAITETNDKVLVHCFAGCSVDNILGAVGMSVEDLFPPRQPDAYEGAQPAVRPRFTSGQLLAVLRKEAAIVMVAAADAGRGRKINQTDRDRVLLAGQRIESAMEAAGGNA